MKYQVNSISREAHKTIYGLHLNVLRFLVIILLAIGVFCRFTNLEEKPYWGDESLTSQRISGYTDRELQRIVLRGKEISVGDMYKYQRPTSEKGLIDVTKALAGNAEHPPLYYLIARFWMQLFGDYLTTPRGLSSLISLLVFPCIYLLCLELFESPLVGWMAIALVSISPFQIIYAQEARQYSLWIVSILLSSWALLRAMRINTKINWGVYTLTLALGLYTHLISVMVAIGHGIYVAANERFRFSKIIIAYLIASLTGFILFVPWIIAIIYDSTTNTDQSPSWSKIPTPFTSLVQTWILNLSRVFFDFNASFTYKNLLPYLFVIILVIYSIYFICRYAPKRVWLFITILMVMPVLLLAIPDLILGGRRSTPIRYFIPSSLSLQLAIAYLLSAKVTFLFVNRWQQKLWQIITVAIISSGVLSCILFSQADTWWNKQREYYHSEVAKIVNQTEHALVIATWYDMRTLSHSLDSHVVLQDIRLRKEINSVGKGFSDVFVYEVKQSLKYFLEHHSNYKIKEAYTWKRQTTPVNTTETTLWQLNKTN
ncbi:MAG TPA: hypothetical protein DCL61_16710 [Cyanobacteria bacterium UBA12227]|nr:hypothetical protein [Cyanobacteria bacterium UBA12227]HAX86985.1 hypothetical protein [Cyanobacteria bacterium UBA11370]HBY79295.1 hypothetical protein [Cyanobacteria bacterium UBA11148]